MVVATHAGTPARHLEHRIELSPNCSLTPVTARLFIASLALVTLPIAGYFAFQGLWPILLIAGLELALVWWAVRLSLDAGRQREIIVVSPDSVVLEQRGLGQSIRMVFPRHWATVKLRDPPVALHPSRLVIESKGYACEVGRFLTEDERRGLAGRLGQLVGGMSESPEL